MFNKVNTNSQEGSIAETIIGQAIKVKGNFQGEGNIIIEGSVEGSIKTNHHLEVLAKASVIGSVDSGSAKVNGEIKGDVVVSGYLELGSSAFVEGNIKSEEISIARGAIINGQIEMTKQQG